MFRKPLLILLAVLLVWCALPSLAEDQPEKGIRVEKVEIEQDLIINIYLETQDCEMAGYYFGVIPDQPAADNYDWIETTDRYLRMTKWPDTYYFWTRDTEGNMYGPTEIALPTDSYLVGMGHGDLSWPNKALSEYLPEKFDMTVDDLNRSIAESVAKAGIYTREGVICGVMTQLNILQGLGIQVPFFHYGYWPFREYGWYVNPDWGTVYHLSNSKEYDMYFGKTRADHEMGTNCSGFVHYAFRLAGLNTVTYNSEGNAGGAADFEKRNSSKRSSPYMGRAGDVLTSSTDHEMLIIDKYDDNKDGVSDGYIVAESSYDTGGIGYSKKPFKDYSRFCRVYNMDGAFYNTGKQTKIMKFWNTYHAPEDTWPDFFREAVTAYTRYKVVFIDAYGVCEEFSVPYGETVTVPNVRNNLDAKIGYWDTDINGVPVSRNYVINAVYTEEDGGISWLEEISRTPEPTETPTPAPTDTPVPTDTPTPAPTDTPEPILAVVRTPEPVLSADSTVSEPAAVSSDEGTSREISPLLLLTEQPLFLAGAGAVLVLSILAVILIIRRRR